MSTWREMAALPPAVRLLLVNQLGVNTGFHLLIPYLAVHLSDDLGMSAAVVGIVLGVRHLSRQGLFVIGGSASDRLGARRVIIAGCALRTAGFALFAIGDGIVVLLAASVVSGLAGALFNPAVRAHLAQEAGERTAEAFTRYGAGPRVLDLGCGTGRDAARLRSAGRTVTGADLSGAMLRYAAREHPEPEYVHADLRDFDLGPRSFDAVVCLDSALLYCRTRAETDSFLASLGPDPGPARTPTPPPSWTSVPSPRATAVPRCSTVLPSPCAPARASPSSAAPEAARRHWPAA